MQLKRWRGDPVEFCLGDVAQADALWDVLADQFVHVLDLPLLVRFSWVAGIQTVWQELWQGRELAALIGGEAQDRNAGVVVLPACHVAH